MYYYILLYYVDVYIYTYKLLYFVDGALLLTPLRIEGG